VLLTEVDPAPEAMAEELLLRAGVKLLALARRREGDLLGRAGR